MRIPTIVAAVSILGACSQLQVVSQDIEERASGVVYAVTEPATPESVPVVTVVETSPRPRSRPDAVISNVSVPPEPEPPRRNDPLFQALFAPKIRETFYLDVAYEWVDKNEQQHRSELRDFLGVDPRQTEWCAAFVNSVLHSGDHAGSESVSEYPLMARSFLEWGEPVNHKHEDPQPGDIVVFPRGRQSWQGHVGFYVDTVTVDGKVYWQILGGNQKNSVRIDLYDPSRALGVRRLPVVRTVQTQTFWQRLFVG
jgi:uncharacterized protein (TIGR02594 family)